MRTGRKTRDFLGLPLTADITQAEIVSEVRDSYFNNKRKFYTFINVNSYFIANHSREYVCLLKDFDGIFSDGIVVTICHRLLNGPCSRNSFDSTSLAPAIFSFAQEFNVPMFFIGSKGDTVQKAAAEVKKNYKYINVAGLSDGFPKDLESQARKIIASGVRIVICGMGAPHQERFLALLKACGFQGICFSCGGYFDQLVNGLDYYPKWINKLNLRFLYRMYCEPSRLIKRYFYDSRFFIVKFIKAALLRIKPTRKLF